MTSGYRNGFMKVQKRSPCGTPLDLRCDRPSPAGQAVLVADEFAARPHIALEAPAVDHFGVEAPIGANAKARQLASTEELVNC